MDKSNVLIILLIILFLFLFLHMIPKPAPPTPSTTIYSTSAVYRKPVTNYVAPVKHFNPYKAQYYN